MIQAKHTQANGHKFDSKYESAVYQQLLRIKARAPIDIEVELQSPVLIKPASDFYPKRHWKIDFLIKYADGKQIYLEAKGHPKSHREMIDSIKHLDLHSPEVHKQLVVVVPNNYSRKKKGTKGTTIRNSLASSICVPVIYYSDLGVYLNQFFRK